MLFEDKIIVMLRTKVVLCLESANRGKAETVMLAT